MGSHPELEVMVPLTRAVMATTAARVLWLRRHCVAGAVWHGGGDRCDELTSGWAAQLKAAHGWNDIDCELELATISATDHDEPHSVPEGSAT